MISARDLDCSRRSLQPHWRNTRRIDQQRRLSRDRSWKTAIDRVVSAAHFENISVGATLSHYSSDGREDVLEKDLRDSVRNPSCSHPSPLIYPFPQFDTNVIGVIHTINAFLPLLRAGPTKKVITISTGIADPAAITAIGLYNVSPYTISKAATNMVVTKYAIQFKDEGFVFLALSPGFVNTLEGPRTPHLSLPSYLRSYVSSYPMTATPDQVATYNAMVETFRQVKPDFERALTPQESVEAQLRVIDGVTVKDTGAFISHHGNNDWL